jgi:transcriptional regulator with XRE-family HTH domain
MAQGKSGPRKAGAVDIYLGNRVRAQRKILDITQDQLGQLIGVTFQQVQKYEKGINRIGPARLVDIAHHLGCTVQSLLSGAPSNGHAETPKSDRAVAMDDLQSMARSNIGMRLVRAYLKLDTPKLRIAVAELAENLSQL